MSESVERSVLDMYHQIKKDGEFPTTTSISGAILSGLLFSRGISAVAGEGAGLLSILPLTLVGGATGYWFDRRRSRDEMVQFLSEHPEIKTSN